MFFYKMYCRIHQNIFKLFAYALPWRSPELFTGADCVLKLPELLQEKNLTNVLLVSDKTLFSLGVLNPLLKELEKNQISVTIYDGAVPNPTVDNVEEALQSYLDNRCVALIAFGGGSSLDCAKGIGARLARPKKSLHQMKGLLKIRKKTPLVFAIPTTAGTGSEVTAVTVINDPKTHEKYAITDLVLIPSYAFLDPLLTLKLPPEMTATTGMDALTHAIEAYIGNSNTKETKELSLNAITLIKDNLLLAYREGSNIEARANMQQAAYDAGRAFTRAYVGYVHGIAHTLGGFYNTPHGLANAVILPHVLKYYGASVHKKLAEISDVLNLSTSTDTLADKSAHVIAWIRDLDEEMSIPTHLPVIRREDIPLMISRCFKECNPTYPVPKILDKNDLRKLYKIIKG